MPRQLMSGAGAAVRAPSPCPSSPLPPQTYRALRARYNALLIALYERSSLTLREIAALAGRTDRAVQLMVRGLGCRPRNAKTCRPGTDVGVRRPGPRPAPLNAPAVRRLAETFAGVARELNASAQARAKSETQRAIAHAERRALSAQVRMIASAARQLRHVTSTIENTAALRQALADRQERKARTGRSRATRATPAKRLPRDEMRLLQQNGLRAQEARMHEAHAARDLAARQAQAAAAAASPESEAERRINAIAERYGAKPLPAPSPGPRIRGL